MTEEKLDHFQKGRSYVAVADFSRLGDVFTKGEALVFDRAAYSRYDECYMYEFVAKDGKVKSWFLLRGETSKDCPRYFLEAT
jgi:hypothetical protein